MTPTIRTTRSRMPVRPAAGRPLTGCMITVRRQFGLVSAEADALGDRLCHHLLAADPSLRLTLSTERLAHRRALVRALAHVILSLDNLDAVMADVRALGAGRAGLPDGHFGQVCEALLSSLADLLGEAFDDEARAAWALALGAVADAALRDRLTPRAAA